MNNLVLAVAVSLMLSVPVVFAAEEPPSSQTAAPSEDSAKQARMMQETMIKMHEQLHKIMAAKDPKERERLKQEQLKTTQEFMKQMRGAMGEPMGSGMMGGGKPGAMGKPADR